MDAEPKNDNPFRQWIRLEQPRLGSRVVYATDDFFAEKERLIESTEPVFIPDKYDANGKWMDGWESRRKRTPGHDHCVVRLGVPGVVRGIDIDTRHFTGNYPPAASIEGCRSEAEMPASDTVWHELLGKIPLSGDSHHWHAIEDDSTVTHLRLHIYPDGGVARLRVYGEVRPDWSGVDDEEIVDLVAMERGGRALAASDEHFGSMHNLNLGGRGINMGDGWETARRRGPGNDWVVMQLGHTGIIEKVEIDTAYFKGNYPDRASIETMTVAEGTNFSVDLPVGQWKILLPEKKLRADNRHYFDDELQRVGPATHVRLNIFPDGGVSRLRLWGRIVR